MYKSAHTSIKMCWSIEYYICIDKCGRLRKLDFDEAKKKKKQKTDQGFHIKRKKDLSIGMLKETLKIYKQSLLSN